MQNAYEDFGVGEVLRQNLLRMNRAVEFVTDPEDFVECECVRDFEDVLDTASFARHFAQGHPQDNSCLPSMLACAKRCIKECFFEFSGICRDKVAVRVEWQAYFKLRVLAARLFFSHSQQRGVVNKNVQFVLYLVVYLST